MPNLQIFFNGMSFVGSAVQFRGETRTLTLFDPVMGAMDIQSPQAEKIQAEWVDLEIPTAMRDETPDQGRNKGTMQDVLNLYVAAYNAELDAITGQ